MSEFVHPTKRGESAATAREGLLKHILQPTPQSINIRTERLRVRLAHVGAGLLDLLDRLRKNGDQLHQGLFVCVWMSHLMGRNVRRNGGSLCRADQSIQPGKHTLAYRKVRTCRSSAVPACMGTHSPNSSTLSSAFIIPVIFPSGAQKDSEGSSRPCISLLRYVCVLC